MSRKVHIRGMGVIGSILARELQAQGIDFSWFDPEIHHQSPKFVAWKASTGCVYPSGNRLDRDNYERFENSAKRLGMEYEVADYCFSQKSIPHHENDKTLKVVEEIDGLKFLNLKSFHVNPQKLVISTRELFKDRYIESPNFGDLVVTAHGFHGVRPTDYRWGWSGEAEVTYQHTPRICFNLKEGRFNNSYLYPKPGTDKYYIGTHFIYQKTPKPLDTEEKVKNIIAHIQSKIEKVATLKVDMSSIVHGWRPAYEESEEVVVEVNGELFLKPQMANGLRHHVTFMEQILSEIKRRI